MRGRVYTTPWGRGGIATLDGGMAALAQRVPPGHSLHVAAKSAKGPWVVRMYRHDHGEVFRVEVHDLAFGIAMALEAVWP